MQRPTFLANRYCIVLQGAPTHGREVVEARHQDLERDTWYTTTTTPQTWVSALLVRDIPGQVAIDICIHLHPQPVAVGLVVRHALRALHIRGQLVPCRNAQRVVPACSSHRAQSSSPHQCNTPPCHSCPQWALPVRQQVHHHTSSTISSSKPHHATCSNHGRRQGSTASLPNGQMGLHQPNI